MEEILGWLKSGAPYLSLCTIVFAVVLWKLILKRAIARHSEKYNLNSRGMIVSVVKALLIFLVVVIICEIHGIHVTTIIAGLGVASVIVGLALQNTLNDVFMGLHIVSDSFFTIGDGVIYEGEEGIVTEMTLRTTKIQRLSDGAVIVICNSRISEITKLSEQKNIDVLLPYSDDVPSLRLAMKQIESAASKLQGVTSCEFRGTQEFGESGTLYRLSFFCDPKDRPELTRQVNGIIQDVLAEKGIQIPFNQLDVHMK